MDALLKCGIRAAINLRITEMVLDTPTIFLSHKDSSAQQGRSLEHGSFSADRLLLETLGYQVPKFEVDSNALSNTRGHWGWIGGRS